MILLGTLSILNIFHINQFQTFIFHQILYLVNLWQIVNKIIPQCSYLIRQEKNTELSNGTHNYHISEMAQGF